MKLCDKIVKLRRAAGLSQEELADRLNVSRQAVSKWESDQSMPDIDKVILLSDLFGVTTDYLLKDSYMPEGENVTRDTASDEENRETEPMAPEILSKDRVCDIIAAKYREARIIAIAVLLFILSPVTLICLATSVDSGFIRQGYAVAIGLAVLFPLVMLGIGLCIYSGFLIADKKLKGTNYALDDYANRLLSDEKSKLRARNLKFYIAGLTLLGNLRFIWIIIY